MKFFDNPSDAKDEVNDLTICRIDVYPDCLNPYYEEDVNILKII